MRVSNMMKMTVYVNGNPVELVLHQKIWEKYKNLDGQAVKENTPFKIRTENVNYVKTETGDYNLESARSQARSLL